MTGSIFGSENKRLTNLSRGTAAESDGLKQHGAKPVFELFSELIVWQQDPLRPFQNSFPPLGGGKGTGTGTGTGAGGGAKGRGGGYGMVVGMGGMGWW